MKGISLILITLLYNSVECVSNFTCPPAEDLFPCECRENPPVLYCSGNTLFNHEFTLIANQIKENKLQFKTIYIQSTRLTHIDNDTFIDGNYDEIYISNNAELEFIDSRAFTGSVKSFKVSSNLKLNQSIFAVMRTLNITENITLSQNPIKEIPDNAFNSQVKNISLINNQIKKIGSNAFSLLSNLQHLNLEYNSIDSLGNNSLNLTANKFRKYINLNYNNLSTKSFADNFLPILKDNQISLHLEDNKIEYLHEKIFRPFMGENGHKIFLARNPFKCDCIMKWVTDRPQSNHVYDVFCEDKKKRIFDLNTQDLGCQQITASSTISITNSPMPTIPTTKIFF